MDRGASGDWLSGARPTRSAGVRVRARPEHFIDGRWVASSGGTATVVSPATNEPIAEVAKAGDAEVAAAVAAARRAFDEGPWPRMAASTRGRYLLRLAALLEEHRDEFAILESLNNGKPIRESATIDVPLAVDCFEYFAGYATKLVGETLPVPGPALSYTLREPVGVVAAITPFNFPLLLATWKIAPALAFGNTVVVKPSSITPLTTLRLAELVDAAGIPPGVVNVVVGDAGIGSALVAHPAVDKVSFTGSTAVGKEIVRLAAETLKRVSLELGGKAPNIVFADAEVDDAVAGSLFGVYWTQGQICTAGSRIYVQRPVFDAFVARFAERAGRLRVGDPLDPRTQIGAIVSRSQCERVLSYIEAGRQAGARILVGGGSADDPELARGNFVRPTVFVDARPDMSIVREEIFGPVAVILPFDDEAEVITAANATHYGLTAGVWTRDVRRAHRVARALRAGTVWVNQYNVIASEAPFGGYRQSGWGRENGPHALEEYTEVKHVSLNLAERATDWFGVG
ncbi:MAG TPA: aldehyde dehydrogenase family protein [Candidatus Binatia bacterium]|nr:aldehyde dehydrogenase family protein [Candidatus Binatia bacterium]